MKAINVQKMLDRYKIYLMYLYKGHTLMVTEKELSKRFK